MTLSEKMKAEAVKNGLCQQWTEEWGSNETIEQMVSKFIRGLDFCIINDFPSLETLREYQNELNEQDVYVDQRIALHNPYRVILNGECNATINVNVGSTEVWVRHNSKAKIYVNHGAKVTVMTLDNADVEVINGFFSKASVYNYSDKTNIVTHGDIRRKDKINFYKK